jgi:hypothetical protein
VYARKAGGKTHTFGVSGSLWRDALILYDRETGSYWSQINGEAILGDLKGRKLEELPSRIMTWGEWRRLHPDTLVLEKTDGPTPNAYADYSSDPSKLGIFGTKNADDRLGGKDWVLGLSVGADSIAFPHEALQKTGFATAVVGGKPIVAVLAREGRGATAYLAEVEGKKLVFGDLEAEAGSVKDRGTGSTWDLLQGVATAGPLSGKRLEQLPGTNAYWFTWIAFYPRTILWTASGD